MDGGRVGRRVSLKSDAKKYSLVLSEGNADRSTHQDVSGMSGKVRNLRKIAKCFLLYTLDG